MCPVMRLLFLTSNVHFRTPTYCIDLATPKIRYVDQIPRAIKGTVQGIIDKKKELDNVEHVMKILDLNHITERDIQDLSGGELQRFAMAIVCIQKADV